ncbi:MAG: GNAT family N-acetyltransferase [Campylobacterales bacterium]|nr:GNAT family N-acetyltransferase [Campylobacterales bacterium]
MQIRQMNLQELDSAFGLIALLHPDLSFEQFESRIYAMRDQNLQLHAIYEHDTPICIALSCVLISVRLGHYWHLFDLITHPQWRFRGYGKAMLGYLRDQARVLGCEHFVIESANASMEALLMFEKEGFEEAPPMLIGSPYM